MSNRFMNRLRPLLSKIEPAAKVIEAATSVLGAVKEPTLFGVANAVAGGLRSLSEVVESSPNGRWCQETVLPYGVIVEALRRTGVDLVEEKDGNTTLTRAYGEYQVVVNSDGEVWHTDNPVNGGSEWVRKALDAVLPPVMRLHVSEAQFQSAEHELSPIPSRVSDRIWRCTSGMLEGGRVILLDGRPGVGKSTCAMTVARDCKLGRVLVVDSSVFGTHAPYFQSILLRMLSLGVIILDDVDKIELPLATLEMLRAEARLVILTANNGRHDTVLDAALMRPARVDEVFTLLPESAEPRAPFDLLDDEDWEEVREWPAAYLNEVEKRLLTRPDDLRLDDLRERLGRKTRSMRGELHDS